METYSPTTIERMPDGSYFGYQSWNNPDGTFRSEIRPNTLGTVAVMSRPRYSVISSRLYDEAPSDSIPASTTNAPTSQTDAGTATPEPEPDNSNNKEKRSLREKIGDRIAGRKNEQTTSRSSNPPSNNQNNQNGPFLQRLLWETKNNNFGPNWWRWRNVGRVGVGASYPAREFVWPAVWKGVKYLTVGPDSVPQSVDNNYVAPTDTLDF